MVSDSPPAREMLRAQLHSRQVGLATAIVADQLPKFHVRGTKDHVLLLPQSRQRINSGRSPCRRIASENRGAQEDDTGQRQGSRIIGLGLEQKRFDKPGRDSTRQAR